MCPLAFLAMVGRPLLLLITVCYVVELAVVQRLVRFGLGNGLCFCLTTLRPGFAFGLRFLPACGILTKHSQHSIVQGHDRLHWQPRCREHDGTDISNLMGAWHSSIHIQKEVMRLLTRRHSLINQSLRALFSNLCFKAT